MGRPKKKLREFTNADKEIFEAGRSIGEEKANEKANNKISKISNEIVKLNNVIRRLRLCLQIQAGEIHRQDRIDSKYVLVSRQAASVAKVVLYKAGENTSYREICQALVKDGVENE